MIRTGRLDRQIIIERATEVQDSIGHPVKNWTAHLTVSAEYIPVSGSEVLRSGREVSGRIARFVIHYNSDITTKDRIQFDSLNWDIKYLREIGRQAGLEITAEALT